MIVSFFSLWLLLAIVKVVFTGSTGKKACSRKRDAYNSMKAYQAIQRQQARQEKEIARENAREERYQEKRAKQKAKITQAEADLDFLIRQQDQICELLYINDEEIESITERIRIDKATRSYDSEKRDHRQKEILLKKRISLESKLHTVEKRIAAAQYTIDGV